MSESLPRNWTLGTISDIAEVNPSGSTVAAGDRELVTFLPMAAVEELSGKIDVSAERPFAEVKKNFTRFREDDVLFAKITPSMENGKVAVARGLRSGIGCGTTEFHVIRPASEVAPDYLRLFLVQTRYRQEAKRNMQGAVGQQRVPPDFVRESPIPVAPAKEQQRIISKIDELFSRIEEGEQALKRVEKLVERYRQSVLKAAVTGELTRDWREARTRAGGRMESGEALLARILKARRTSWEAAELAKFKAKGKTPANDRWKQKYAEPRRADTPNLPELPEGWVWVTVEQLAAPEKNSVTDGPFGANLKTEHYTDAGPRVVRLQNIKDGFFSHDKAHISEEHFQRLQKHRVFAGDLLLAALGETLPRACIAPASLGPAIVKADCIRFKPSSRVSSGCLMAFLNAEPTRQRTAAIVHGVGRPRLNLAEIRSLAVPLPSEAEQQEIASRIEMQLNSASQLALSLVTQTAYAHGLRQSILGAAFSGQLVPQDSNDEPASKLLERIAAERTETARAIRKRKKKVA